MSKAKKKRSLTLNLNDAAPRKRTRLVNAATPSFSDAQSPPILTTPDVQMLKLSSPELAKFLTVGPDSLVTPTPSSVKGILFPKSPGEERQIIETRFQEALAKENSQTQVNYIF